MTVVTAVSSFCPIAIACTLSRIPLRRPLDRLNEPLMSDLFTVAVETAIQLLEIFATRPG